MQVPDFYLCLKIKCNIFFLLFSSLEHKYEKILDLEQIPMFCY